MNKLSTYHLRDQFFDAPPHMRFEGGNLCDFQCAMALPCNVAAFYIAILRKKTPAASDALTFNIVGEDGAQRGISAVLHYPDDAPKNVQHAALMVDLSAVAFTHATILYFDGALGRDIFLGAIEKRAGHFIFKDHKNAVQTQKDELKTAVFIGGTPRSGNTWLSRMLNSHPDALVPNTENENWFFGWPEPRDLRHFIETHPRPGFFNLIAAKPAPAMAAYMQTGAAMSMLSAAARAAGVTVAGDKSPNNALGMADALFLDARIRYIHLTRQPEDFCTSLFFHHWNVIRKGGNAAELDLKEADVKAIRQHMEAGDGKSFFNESVLTNYMGVWERHNRAGFDALTLFPERVLWLTYEDMVADSAGALARVLHFLNLDADAERVAEINTQNSFEKLSGGRRPGTEDRNSFYRRGEAGAYKTFLAPEAVAFIATVMKTKSIRFLYLPLGEREAA